MSYILDALRKAEQERALGQTPDLGTFPKSAAPSRRRLWPWGWALVIVLNATVLAFLWWSVREDVRPSTASPVEVETTAVPPAMTAAPTETRPPSAPSQAVELAADLPTAPAPEAPRPATVTEPEPSVQAADLPSPEPRFSQSAPTPGIQAPPAPSAQVKIETVPEARPPPVLRAMSESFRRSLPALNLDVHVYGERPEHRFVMINARRYNEGDWLNEGPLLETITADGVILRYQGQRFMLEVPH